MKAKIDESYFDGHYKELFINERDKVNKDIINDIEKVYKNIDDKFDEIKLMIGDVNYISVKRLMEQGDYSIPFLRGWEKDPLEIEFSVANQCGDGYLCSNINLKEMILEDIENDNEDPDNLKIFADRLRNLADEIEQVIMEKIANG